MILHKGFKTITLATKTYLVFCASAWFHDLFIYHLYLCLNALELIYKIKTYNPKPEGMLLVESKCRTKEMELFLVASLPGGFV